MLRKYIYILFWVTLISCATPPQVDITPSLKGNYTLDPTHASVVWSLSHVGLSNYTARFDKISGQLDFDAENPTRSQLDVRIDPASVSTGLPDFDTELSEDSKYFDSGTYPEIRFTSDTITQTSDVQGRITGLLTLKGVTKPVTLDVTYNGAGSSFGHPGKTLGFSARGTFLRSDFNMGHLTNFGIGDEVSLRIEAEFNETR